MAKRLFLIALVCLVAIQGFSQNVIYDNGMTKVYENGVVYSSDGFVEKTVVPDSNSNYKSSGIYTKDGKVFVSAIFSFSTSFYVADGTEYINKKAFYFLKSSTIRLPKSVRFIDPEAFLSYLTDSRNDARMIDEASSAKEIEFDDVNIEETVRYNLQGMRLEEPHKGVNIVRYTDNSAKKVVVK